MRSAKSSNWPRNALATIVRVLIAVVVNLLLIELGLRAFYPQLTYSRAFEMVPTYYRHSELMPFELQRNFSGDVRSGELVETNTYHVTTNSEGLRDDEFDLQTYADSYRILMLGDSMTFGYSVSDEYTYPALLEECLNSTAERADSYVVINAGYADGFSPDSYYIFLREFAPAYDPDLVIVGYTVSNDFADLLETQWLDVENGLPGRVQSRLREVDVDGRWHNREVGLRYSIPILRESHLFQLLVDRNIIGISPEGQVMDTVEYQFQDIFNPQLPTYLQDAFQRSMEMVSAMGSLSAEWGDSFLVAILPADMQSEAGQWYPNVSGLEYPESADMAYPQRAIRAYLDDQGIAYFDLLPSFWGQEMWQNYLLPNGHWTPAGNQVTADALCGYILERGLGSAGE